MKKGEKKGRGGFFFLFFSFLFFSFLFFSFWEGKRLPACRPPHPPAGGLMVPCGWLGKERTKTRETSSRRRSIRIHPSIHRSTQTACSTRPCCACFVPERVEARRAAMDCKADRTRECRPAGYRYMSQSAAVSHTCDTWIMYIHPDMRAADWIMLEQIAGDLRAEMDASHHRAPPLDGERNLPLRTVGAMATGGASLSAAAAMDVRPDAALRLHRTGTHGWGRPCDHSIRRRRRTDGRADVGGEKAAVWRNAHRTRGGAANPLASSPHGRPRIGAARRRRDGEHPRCRRRSVGSTHLIAAPVRACACAGSPSEPCRSSASPARRSLPGPTGPTGEGLSLRASPAVTRRRASHPIPGPPCRQAPSPSARRLAGCVHVCMCATLQPSR